MRRLARPLILTAAILLAIGAGRLSAAVPGLAFMPIARSAPAPSTCNASAPILDRDVGSLDAGYRAGEYYVAYQDRQAGGRGHVARHEGAGLVEVQAAPGLAFSPPDSVKVGSVALVLEGPTRRLYYTSRALDAEPNVGPYALWCVEF